MALDAFIGGAVAARYGVEPAWVMAALFAVGPRGAAVAGSMRVQIRCPTRRWREASGAVSPIVTIP